tara:strand:+ start:852 stop:1976 length:1125 start_codon:yes stop_codon:yes gene_type:complete
MKFIISSTDFLKSIQSLIGIVINNPALPIIENVLLEISPNNLNIKATDLETTIITRIKIESKSTQSLAINAKLLLDTLKAFPEQPLTFKTNDANHTIEIISEQGNYSLAYIDGEEFPNTPNIENATKSSVPANILEQGINNTLFATGNDELRPVMCGILCEINIDNILFVATDAHKLVKYQHKIDSGSSTSFILPKKPLQLIKNIVNQTNEEIIIQYNNSNVIFSFNEMDIYCRLIDGNYPNYHAVIPKENPNTLNIDRLALLNSLKRVAIFSNQSTNQIKFSIKGSELSISSEDIDFSNKANERMTCQYDGTDMDIGFNGKFLIDILNTLKSDRVDMFLSSPSKAAILKPDSDNKELDEDILMLVMPVMLQQV